MSTQKVAAYATRSLVHTSWLIARCTKGIVRDHRYEDGRGRGYAMALTFGTLLSSQGADGTPARTFRTDWGQPTKLYSVRSTRSTRRPLHGRATERRPLNRTTTIPALIPAARNDLEPPAPVTASPRSSASASCRRAGSVVSLLGCHVLTGGPVRPGAVAVRDLVSPTWVGRAVRRRAPGSAGGPDRERPQIWRYGRPPSGRIGPTASGRDPGVAVSGLRCDRHARDQGRLFRPCPGTASARPRWLSCERRLKPRTRVAEIETGECGGKTVNGVADAPGGNWAGAGSCCGRG